MAQALMSIDLKKNRIRIHRNTLRMLGDPEYIQILINPGSRFIVIKSSTKTDHLSHRVRPSQLTANRSYELYSTYFIQALRSIIYGINPDILYRLYGIINREENLVRFSMDSAAPVTEIERKNS